jgi:hypothetical protein
MMSCELAVIAIEFYVHIMHPTLQLLVLALCVTCRAFAQVAISVNPAGTYNVSVASIPFLVSAPISICVKGVAYSLNDGSLKVNGTSNDSGTDSFGEWTSTNLVLTAPSGGFSFITMFKSYAAHSDLAVVTASFPQSLDTSGCGNVNNISVQFPSFRTDLAAAPSVRALSWAGEASEYTHVATGLGNLGNSGLDSGPVVLNHATDATLVVSTLDNHKIIGQVTQSTGSLSPLTSLWSAERSDQVVCLSPLCTSDQQPNGNYDTQRIEGYGFTTASESVLVAGKAYSLVPLTAYYSASWTDNSVISNNSGPDASYNYKIDNGYVLSTQAPGTIPLQVWLKVYDASHQDYASVASAAGVQWAKNNGYTYVFNAGYVFQNASSIPTAGSYYALGLTAAIAAGIPAGFQYSVILFSGTGITSTVYAWGAALQGYYNTTRMPSTTLSNIGVYTDDGAYYYVWEAFNIAPRPWPAEIGLKLVIDALYEQGVQPRYLQLDDWWYDGPFYFGNVKCVENWVGDNATILFPHGLPAFQQSLGLPLILYTPFWCDTYVSPYNMTPSTQFSNTKIVVPDDSYAFFRDLMTTGT